MYVLCFLSNQWNILLIKSPSSWRTFLKNSRQFWYLLITPEYRKGSNKLLTAGKAVIMVVCDALQPSMEQNVLSSLATCWILENKASFQFNGLLNNEGLQGMLEGKYFIVVKERSVSSFIDRQKNVTWKALVYLGSQVLFWTASWSLLVYKAKWHDRWMESMADIQVTGVSS